MREANMNFFLKPYIEELVANYYVDMVQNARETYWD